MKLIKLTKSCDKDRIGVVVYTVPLRLRLSVTARHESIKIPAGAENTYVSNDAEQLLVFEVNETVASKKGDLVEEIRICDPFDESINLN